MAQAEKRYTFAEYLALECVAETKHEFVDGQIIAMSGGTPRHSALASRVSAALENGRRKGCIAFQSDMLIRVLATGRATYPDASVVCGPFLGDPADPERKRVLTNPTLIVEVLSPSTEKDDRGSKWRHYLPSLKEYVLVSQDERRIERYRRNDSGTWEYLEVSEGQLELATGGALDIAKLYDDLPE